MPFWYCEYVSGWGGACGGREDDEDAWSGSGGGSSGAEAGLVGRVRGGAACWEVVALLSFLACWGLEAGAPLFLRNRFGWTEVVGLGERGVGRRAA